MDAQCHHCNGKIRHEDRLLSFSTHIGWYVTLRDVVEKEKRTWDSISTSVRNSTDKRCSCASFLPRLMATMRPSLRRPLYTMPNPPCPILLDWEKLAVALLSSAMVNVSAPGDLAWGSMLELKDWKPRRLLCKDPVSMGPTESVPLCL